MAKGNLFLIKRQIGKSENRMDDSVLFGNYKVEMSVVLMVDCLQKVFPFKNSNHTRLFKEAITFNLIH